MSDIVPLKQYSFRLINLPKHYNKSLSNLIDHIESIIEANEKCYGECEEFYIGKSTMLQKGKEKTKYIHDHWNRRKVDGYHAMVVLTAVPHSQHSAQQYTTDLKKDLIKHFRREDDERLQSKTTGSGRPAKSGAAYVLYLAMKFDR